MATLSLLQQDPKNDLVPSLVAATSGGDAYQQDGNVVLHVKNASGGSITATIASHASPGPGETTAPHVTVIAAGTTAHIGPLSAAAFADPTTNLSTVTYSAVTSVTVCAIRNAPQQS